MSARAIVVDGVEIPEALLAQEVQHHPGGSAAEARAAAGHALAIRALLLQRARDLGVSVTREIDAANREETLEEALIRGVLEEEIHLEPPGDAECRRVYDAHPHRFRSPPLMEASHILIEGDEDDEGARALAAAVAEMVVSGACTFAEAASDYSACPSGAVGGSLGQLRPGDLAKEIEAVLAGLSPGEIAAGPVRSRFGWHIVRLDRRIDARRLPFEAVAEQIRLHLESRAWVAAAARYTADLAADARTRGVALSLSDDGATSQGSATLGSIMDVGGATERLEPWLNAVDPALARRVHSAAGDEPFADFVRAAFADFVAEADDERWTNLISAACDATDPALSCLAFVLRSKLEPVKQTFTLIKRVSA